VKSRAYPDVLLHAHHAGRSTRWSDSASGRGRLPDVLLVGRLPSMPLADACSPLFGHFVGILDRPTPTDVHVGLLLTPSPAGRRISRRRQWGLPFSRVEFPYMPGVSDCAESAECSR